MRGPVYLKSEMKIQIFSIDKFLNSWIWNETQHLIWIRSNDLANRKKWIRGAAPFLRPPLRFNKTIFSITDENKTTYCTFSTSFIVILDLFQFKNWLMRKSICLVKNLKYLFNIRFNYSFVIAWTEFHSFQ